MILCFDVSVVWLLQARCGDFSSQDLRVKDQTNEDLSYIRCGFLNLEDVLYTCRFLVLWTAKRTLMHKPPCLPWIHREGRGSLSFWKRHGGFI